MLINEVVMLYNECIMMCRVDGGAAGLGVRGAVRRGVRGGAARLCARLGGRRGRGQAGRG